MGFNGAKSFYFHKVNIFFLKECQSAAEVTLFHVNLLRSVASLADIDAGSRRFSHFKTGYIIVFSLTAFGVDTID